MEQLIDLLVNIDVFLYVGLVVAIQFAYTKSVRTKKERIENNRKAQELPKGSLVNQTRKLEELKARYCNPDKPLSVAVKALYLSEDMDYVSEQIKA